MTTAHLRPAAAARRRSPARIRGRLVTAALASAALLVPVAAVTQSASAEGKTGTGTTTAACTAGATKKDHGTVVAVCNTKGKWVKTVNLDGGDGGNGTVDQGAAGASTGGAVAPDTVAQREDRAAGSGSAPVGCVLNDGTTVPPGETIAIVSITTDSHGNVIKHAVDNWICGDDGQFHLVARLASPPNFTRVGTVAATDRQVS